MKALYIRVSTTDQNSARQEVDTEGLQVFTDRCSGAIPFGDRPAGGRIMEALEAGELEALEVHSLDRLGRNLLDTLQIIEQFTEAGVSVHVRKEALTTLNSNGTPNQSTKLLLGILGSVAEAERETIRERQREGIAAAKLAGKYIGRPGHGPESRKVFLAKPKTKKIKRLLKQGLSQRQVAKVASCSLTTVSKVKRIARIGEAEPQYSTETANLFEADK